MDASERFRSRSKGIDVPVRSSAIAILSRVGLDRIARAVLRRSRLAAARIRSLRPPLQAAGARLKAWPSTRRLLRSYRAILATRIAFTQKGTPGTDAIAVIVCLWIRPERLEDILRIADSQRSTRPIRLVLWNNNPAHNSDYLARINAFEASGSLASIEFHASANNIGGVGRFVAARELTRRGYGGPFIMLDDDQDFGPEFVQTLLDAWSPRTVAGVWAWSNDGAYWSRTQVTTDGSPAMHIGTGGSICDSAIVRDDRFFTAIPTRYLFMEDIWMSRVALRNGWQLRMVAVPVEFVLSDLDQGHALFDRKEGFYDWLKDERRLPVLTSPGVGAV
jgi:hypothetical protein